MCFSNPDLKIIGYYYCTPLLFCFCCSFDHCRMDIKFPSRMSMEMKEKPLQTSFHFKTLPNGLVDEDIVVCNLCLSELKCHISTISLTYHLKSKTHQHENCYGESRSAPNNWQMITGRCLVSKNVLEMTTCYIDNCLNIIKNFIWAKYEHKSWQRVHLYRRRWKLQEHKYMCLHYLCMYLYCYVQKKNKPTGVKLCYSSWSILLQPNKMKRTTAPSSVHF